MIRVLSLLVLFSSTSIAAPPVTSLAYRADGKLLVAGSLGTVTLVDPASGDYLASLPGQTSRVTALAFSKAGTLAVASGEPGKSGIIRLFELADPIITKLKVEIPAHRDIIYTLAFSPDGKTLASAGYDRVIKLWNIAKIDTPLHTLQDHSDTIYSVAFSPNGKLLASGSADRAVKVWDAANGKRLYTLSDPTDWVYAVAWSPDGTTLAAGGVDKSIRTWHATATEGKLLNSVFAHPKAVTQLQYASDGKTLVSAGEDAVVKLWDSAKMVERKVFPKQSEFIHALALRPDGKQLAVGRFDGTGILFDPASNENGKAFLPAKPKPPAATKITPNAVVRGSTVRVTIDGQRLDTTTAIQGTGVTAKIISASPTRLQADLTLAPSSPIGANALTLVSDAGTSLPFTFMIDRFTTIREAGSTDSANDAQYIKRPVTIIGSLDRSGDVDHFAFEAKGSEAIGVEALITNGKIAPRLAINDVEGRVLHESDSSQLGFRAPKAGRYVLSLRDQEFRGGQGFTYRLNVGDVPVVTSVFPLAVPRGSTATVHVDGVHLSKSGPLTVTVPADAAIGSRVPLPIPGANVAVCEFPSTIIADSGAELRGLPATADGIIAKPGESRTLKFTAKKGEPLVVEAHARRLGSPLDSHIELLDAAGNLLPRATLRCVAKTYSVFRDNDSVTNGIRIESWNELAINDYIFVGTELMRIDALPKGPDDDCRFVARSGQRLGFLGTTPTHHYVGNVMYKVEIHPPGTNFAPNGMPVFPIAWRNDDGGPGFNKDSMLLFDPPADGVYQVRITDARGEGSSAHAFRLTVRPPRPDFTLSVSPMNPSVWKGNGLPITVSANRTDGFEGPISLSLAGVAKGFQAHATTIEAEQVSTAFTLFASADAPPPTSDITVTATATINGKPVTRTITLGKPQLVEPGDLVTTVSTPALVIQPGKETRFTVNVERRNNFKGRVPLDVRGLPHGVRVLNIGLNGILLTERDTSREVVIYAEPWVQPMTRPISVLSRRESTGKEYAAVPVLLTVKN